MAPVRIADQELRPEAVGVAPFLGPVLNLGLESLYGHVLVIDGSYS